VNEFSTLFRPGNIGTLRLKNRLIMPAMGTQLADAEGKVTERLLSYYRARARGGVGLIIPQCASVSLDASIPFTLAIHNDSCIADWRTLVEALHAVDTKICIQLIHMGMLFISAGFVPQGGSIKVPSIMPWLEGDKPYHELDEGDIDRYVEGKRGICRSVQVANVPQTCDMVISTLAGAATAVGESRRQEVGNLYSCRVEAAGVRHCYYVRDFSTLTRAFVVHHLQYIKIGALAVCADGIARVKGTVRNSSRGSIADRWRVDNIGVDYALEANPPS